MAYKANRASRELKILLNKNSEDSIELKELIIELIQFSIILDEEINSEKVRKAINLTRGWGINSGKQPRNIRDFQILKQKAKFDLMGFINYEANILSNIDFFDIQSDLKRNI